MIQIKMKTFPKNEVLKDFEWVSEDCDDNIIKKKKKNGEIDLSS